MFELLAPVFLREGGCMWVQGYTGPWALPPIQPLVLGTGRQGGGEKEQQLF